MLAGMLGKKRLITVYGRLCEQSIAELLTLTVNCQSGKKIVWVKNEPQRKNKTTIQT